MSDKLVPLSRVIEILDEVPDTIAQAPEVTPLVIDRLTALADATPDYDALAERVEKLHEALREHVLHGPITDNDHAGPFVSNGCMHCHASWSPSTTESHAPDCLAAPEKP